MNEEQFEKIWHCVLVETNNRQKGAFNRALWYGGRGFITKSTVGAKGLRKQIRNVPGKLAGGGIKLACGAIPVPLLKDAIKASVEPARGLVKKLYSSKLKKKIRKEPPRDAEEALRKKVKADIKRLEKESILQVIDRNMVKLRDAKSKVDPSVQKLMQSSSHMSYAQVSSNLAVPTDKQQENLAYNSLRAFAETEYYADKIIRISATLRHALESIEKDLLGINTAMEEQRSHVEDYIKEYL